MPTWSTQQTAVLPVLGPAVNPNEVFCRGERLEHTGGVGRGFEQPGPITPALSWQRGCIFGGEMPSPRQGNQFAFKPLEVSSLIMSLYVTHGSTTGLAVWCEIQQRQRPP
ncbi:hypothetical protein DPEC_G00193380 [Dallia pectoralis]|uniref:Uncharacterized protein n=1 Tax=Dallia pectoralis TaxID=75939 RepID=A0ACC2G6V3_DALPE|nr:hypothetical protein DPEC_G00193380 [Dallia pectoralis]